MLHGVSSGICTHSSCTRSSCFLGSYCVLIAVQTAHGQKHHQSHQLQADVSDKWPNHRFCYCCCSCCCWWRFAGDDNGEEEAEYAWLPYIHIKPFNLGDISGNDSGIPPADPVLLASVAAAEAMLRTSQQQSAQQQQQRRSSDDGSDSEGGWGESREQQPPPPPPGPRNVRGRIRTIRARGKRANRGRTSRAIRGRRGFTPEDDENSDSEGWVGDGMNGTTAAAAVSGSKSVVEAILAWRAPRTQQDLQKEQVCEGGGLSLSLRLCLSLTQNSRQQYTGCALLGLHHC